MKLPIYFISDNHFQMTDDPVENNRRKKLFSLFSKIQSTNGTLVIGGDFFDFWFDYGYFIPQEYNDLFEKLEELHLSGIEIHYVAGNHDYWDFGYFKKKFNANFYKEDFNFSIDGTNILVTHGDGILKADKGYRLLKKIIRNKFNIFLFRLLPAKLGCKLAKKVSSTSRHYGNQNNQNHQIISELKLWSNDMLKQNLDVILFGHYHQVGISNINKKKVIFMGEWVTQFTVTVFDGKEWHQYPWNT